MVVGETLQPLDSLLYPLDSSLHPMSPFNQCSTSNSTNTAESQVDARMDQLQNQLNQVLLTIQSAQTDTFILY